MLELNLFPEKIVNLFAKTVVKQPEEVSVKLEYYNNNLVIAAVYVLLLISIYIFFFSKQKEGFLKFVKSIMFIPTVIGGILIYYIGYHVKEPELNWVVKGFLSFFSTARLFILGNDLVEVHENVNNNYLIWFSVFSVSAALISTAILVNLLGKNFKSWIKIKFNRSKSNYIFLGLNNAGVTLAKDIKRKNPTAFIVFVQNILSTEDISLENMIYKINALIVNPDSFLNSLNLQHEEFIFLSKENHNEHEKENNELNIKHWGLLRKISRRPTRIFVLSENEDHNFHLAQLFIEQIKKNKIVQEINVHVRTMTNNMEEIYDKIIRDNETYANIHLHNQSYITACQLVKDNLPVKWLKEQYPKCIMNDSTVNRDFTTLFIGFGFICSAAFRKLFEQGQFIGSNFKAILIDKEMDARKGEFIHRYPGVVDTMKEYLEFYDLKVNTVEFYDLIKKYALYLDYIIISLGNDELNIKIAHDIKYFLYKIKPIFRIFFQVSDSKNYHKNEQIQDDSIQVFGHDNDVFTEDIIIKEEIEGIAKGIHVYYNDRAHLNNKKDWKKLSRFAKDSNISVVEHTITKLILSGIDFPKAIEDVNTGDVSYSNLLNGFELVYKILKYDSYYEIAKEFGTEKIENLGKTEHLRWNAFHFINGWTKWDLNDIPIDEKENKNEDKKIHACLVNWDELDNVTLRYKPYSDDPNFDYKTYDLNCMNDIYKNAKNGLFFKNNNKMKENNNKLIENIELIETLAKNVHNQWMTIRLSEGWKLGKERNDKKKEHPSLIPYDELSEVEKEYDRQTVIVTLKYLDDKGYDIIKR